MDKTGRRKETWLCHRRRAEKLETYRDETDGEKTGQDTSRTNRRGRQVGLPDLDRRTEQKRRQSQQAAEENLLPNFTKSSSSQNGRMEGVQGSHAWLHKDSRNNKPHEKTTTTASHRPAQARLPCCQFLTLKTPLKFPQKLFGRHPDPWQPTLPAAICLLPLSSPSTFSPVLWEKTGGSVLVLTCSTWHHIPANPDVSLETKSTEASLKNQNVTDAKVGSVRRKTVEKHLKIRFPFMTHYPKIANTFFFFFCKLRCLWFSILSVCVWVYVCDLHKNAASLCSSSPSLSVPSRQLQRPAVSGRLG